MADSGQTFFKCATCGVFFATMEAFVQHDCAATDATCQQTDSERSPDDSPAETLSTDDSRDPAAQTEVWTKAATLLLINEFSKLKDRQEAGFLRKKQMWEKIKEEMQNSGYRFSADQISGRWKTLLRAYKNMKDHNSKSGNNPKKYEFSDELDALFEKDPVVVPQALRSSAKRPAESETVDQEEESTEDVHSPSSETAKKSRSRSGAREVVELFRSYLDDQKQKEQEETARRERMHTERMQLMQNLIQAISGNARKEQ